MNKSNNIYFFYFWQAGNYSGAYVYMGNNNLTTLQSGAFQKMIEQMRNYGGSLSVYESKKYFL